jgi:hypothetical protein
MNNQTFVINSQNIFGRERFHLGQLGFEIPRSQDVSVNLGVSGTSGHVVTDGFGGIGHVIGVSRHDFRRTGRIHQGGTGQSQRALINLNLKGLLSCQKFD